MTKGTKRLCRMEALSKG